MLFRTTPADMNQILKEDERINICFTEDVDNYTVEKICSLKDSSGSRACGFQWEDSKNLMMVPEDPLVPGIRYTLEICGIYCNRDGLERDVEFSLPFYYLTDSYDPLLVLEVEPFSGESMSSGSCIVLRFNRVPEDQAELMKNLTLIPHEDFSYMFSGLELTISPEEQWENLTDYTIRINGGVTDPEWESSFIVNDGAGIPLIEKWGSAVNDREGEFPFKAVDSDQMTYRDVLRIDFSMDKDSAEAAFRLSPSPEGDLYWTGRRSLVFVPREGWQRDTDYTVLVNQSAAGENGISMDSVWQKQIKPAIPEMKLQILECVTGGFSLMDLTGPDSCLLPSDPISPYAVTFRLTFSEPFLTDREKQNLQELIHLYEVFSSDGNPRAASWSWIDPFTLTILYTGFYASSEKDHFYLFEINGGESGIRNDGGSFMEQDAHQLFRSRL